MTYTLEEEIAIAERRLKARENASKTPNKKFYENMKLYGGPTPAHNPYAGSSNGTSSYSMGDAIGQFDFSPEDIAKIKAAKEKSEKENGNG